jgi:Zn-dependent protease
VINERISHLGRELEQGKPPTKESSHGRGAWAGIVAVLVLILSKAKFLLLGLTKWKTVFSMLVFLGVYLQAWGWKFALGFVLGIYVHEMGHVFALRRYGIAASAPMFIPGLGAFIRLKQYPANAHQDAVVGLAGPVWGLGAGLVAWAIGLATGSGIWMGIAQSTAFINLFNLIPFWQLDGGRGFRALNRWQRWVAALVIGGVWSVSHQGMLLLLLVLAVFQAFQPGPEDPDYEALGTYAGLVIALAWLSSIKVVTT